MVVSQEEVDGYRVARCRAMADSLPEAGSQEVREAGCVTVCVCVLR